MIRLINIEIRPRLRAGVFSGAVYEPDVQLQPSGERDVQTAFRKICDVSFPGMSLRAAFSFSAL